MRCIAWNATLLLSRGNGAISALKSLGLRMPALFGDGAFIGCPDFAALEEGGRFLQELRVFFVKAV